MDKCFAFVSTAAGRLDRATREIPEFCTFVQTMVQSVGPGLWGRFKSKGVTDRLRPIDGSKAAIGSFKSQAEEPKPEGRR
jgi:hypothetical protein